ncbi:MAG: hypothetical protein J6Q13_01765 [Clostridia bacterium]|nr:hypothetical protein [Clostridia bacterium]
MEKFNKDTKYSILKHTALAMILAKQKRFTLNNLMVEMADKCAEDVSYDRCKQAITETIEEMIKENQLKEFEGEYGLTLNEKVSNWVKEEPIETKATETTIKPDVELQPIEFENKYIDG